MSILDRILARTRADLAARQAQVPLGALQAACERLAPGRDFAAALRRDGGERRRRGAVRVIAEVKRASPSRGVIRREFPPAALARAYAAAGARAVSVLTDQPFFQGSLADLAVVREAVELPVLRKDFHVDGYQLWEARAAGADAVLLIVATLTDAALGALLTLARRLTLGALVEVHDRQELTRAVAAGAAVIGINNRDLATFEVSLAATFDLVPDVPASTVLVSESGIGQREDVVRLGEAGVDAILVGEALLREPDVGAALRRLTGC
ncbi:MAG: indole-3-glycerol phosphate synthase TrpC [Acidobacteria bacterium]|nr:MAG: indole-3-glycerol phosphate synthase TrpC [Acidobacteriota bacterium]